MKYAREIIFWTLAIYISYLLFDSVFTLGSGNVNAPTDDDALDGGAGVDGYVDLAYSNSVGILGAIVSAQKVSAQGQQMTATFEGCQLTAYEDAGSPSIGYGHKPAKTGQTCTQAQANAWLASDLNSAANYVLSRVTGELAQNQLDALADWVYNCGSGKTASSTVWSKLNSGDIAGAMATLQLWVNSQGQPLPSLQRRRQAEVQLFQNGTYA